MKLTDEQMNLIMTDELAKLIADINMRAAMRRAERELGPGAGEMFKNYLKYRKTSSRTAKGR